MSISKNKLKEIKDHFREVVKAGNTFLRLLKISEDAYLEYEEELIDLAEAGDEELREISDQLREIEDSLFR